MLVPVEGQELPSSKFSKRFISCQCTCGNPDILSVRWNTFARRTPTCGKCVLIQWKASGVIKYGKLTLNYPLDNILAMTQPVAWKCDCGNSKISTPYLVVSGHVSSCGCAYHDKLTVPRVVYPELSREEWLQKFPALVNEDLPERWSRKARLTCKFRCACSRVFTNSFNNYADGRKCGHCNDIILHHGDIVHGFIYDGEDRIINPKSKDKISFKCQTCGNSDDFILRYLYSGERSRCQFCNQVTAKELDGKKFGRLTIKNPQDLSKYSTEKVTWICDCGNEHQAIASNVLNGIAKSCGNCRKNVHDWWRKYEKLIQDMKCPINVDELPEGGIIPLEIIENTKDPFSAKCPVCSRTYKPRWEGIRLGVSLTCGCSSNRISSGQNDIFKFIQSLGISAQMEHPVNSLKYDIFVPSADLLIEYNGLKWHSQKYSKQRDWIKYQNALSSGYKFLSIFEDEWVYNRHKIEDVIRTKLGFHKPASLRPSRCSIRKINHEEADKFYEQYHYIGVCKSKMNYGAFYEEKLIACTSFKNPTRQSKHPWELVRMASDPKFRVHGIWSKLLKQFINDVSPQSIVSFSDNRLFAGGVYGKIGFKLDGDVNQDYYWCKGQKRHHKSTLRKKGEEKTSGLTEIQLREAQGYSKIWDLGKKRWVWIP
jgi:hypothetical protein